MFSVMLLKMFDCLLAKILNGAVPKLLCEMLRSVLVPGMYPEMFPDMCFEMNFPVVTSLGMFFEMFPDEMFADEMFAEEMVLKMFGCLLIKSLTALSGLLLPICMFMNLELYSP